MNQPESACSAELWSPCIDAETVCFRHTCSNQRTKYNVYNSNGQHYTYDSFSGILVKTHAKESLDKVEYRELGQEKVMDNSEADQFAGDLRFVVPAKPASTCVKRERKEKLLECAKRWKKIFLDMSKIMQTNYFKSSIKTKSGTYRTEIIRASESEIDRYIDSLDEKALLSRKIKLRPVPPRKQLRFNSTIAVERSNILQITRPNGDYVKKIHDCITNSINLNRLKIQADSNTDIDYVRRMSTLSVYDTNYRNSVEENHLEDSIQYQPNLAQQLNELKISNVQDKNILIPPCNNSVDNTNDLNALLHSHLSLNNENNVDIASNNLLDVKYSKNFRE